MKNRVEKTKIQKSIIRTKVVGKRESAIRKKMEEANARRSVNEKWMRVEESLRYRRALLRQMLNSVTEGIWNEIVDGLSLKWRGKSTTAQNRVLRRIIEKRQSQANHRIGRKNRNVSMTYVSACCTRVCIGEIRRRRLAV